MFTGNADERVNTERPGQAQIMRFVADGPIFPDELLTARDEGQVLFFCGAGVSRARAQLPDFYGLADKVVDALNAAPDSCCACLPIGDSDDQRAVRTPCHSYSVDMD